MIAIYTRKRDEGAIVGLFDYRGKFHHTAHCPDNDFVLQYTSQYLDNLIEQLDGMPDQEDSDMAKINRNIILNGKQHCIRANTEQEYVDKLARILGTYQEPVATKDKHNFTEYARNWYNIYSAPNIESATKINYKRQLEKYILPAIGDMNIEDITSEDIQKIFNSMNTAKTSKKVVKTVLNQILSSAFEDEYIVRNPLQSSKVKITGAASKATRPYSVDQIRYLIKHIPDIRKKLDQAYIALQALHGLRLEEVLGLQWGDIDLDKRLIYVRRAATHPDRNKPVIKETKTADSVRPIGLSTLAVPYLIPGKLTDFIVGGTNPLSYQQVREMCKRIRRDTGFNENVTPIRFRTTALTDAYEQTSDIKLVQQVAGHTTSAMTLEHYVKGRKSISQVTAALDQLYAPSVKNAEKSASPECRNA